MSVILPSIPDRESCILDYGVKRDGSASCTQAINKAIRDCSERGGRLVFPRGIYRTGPIELLSSVELHLEKGALILFDKSREEYPVIVTDYEGQPRLRTVSPIHAEGQHDIAITGDGIIDGSGHLWRPVKSWKVTEREWKDLLGRSRFVVEGNEKVWVPSKSIYEGIKKGEIRTLDEGSVEMAAENYDLYRPVLVSIRHCSRVLIEGVTIQNSPAWNVHPLFTDNLTIRNCTIRNPYYAQNGDGLDIESCTHVEVDSSSFDVGDDAICIKSGKDRIARTITGPSSDISIHDCTVYHGHGGFVIGSEMSRGVRDVSVRDCTFIGTDTGLRFKSAIPRGGVVERISISGIDMIDIKEEAVVFDMGYVLNTNGKDDVFSSSYTEDDIPVFRDIDISGIVCRGARTAIRIDGLEEKNIRGIHFRDSYFLAFSGSFVSNAEDVTFENTVIEEV